MQFLGTGAADAIPNPFCTCTICRDARLNPNHTRLRSMFLLDKTSLIDCGPDLAAACMINTVELDQLSQVFVTHTHEDHFYPSNVGLLMMSRTRGGQPVDVYLSHMALAVIDSLLNALESNSHLDAIKAYNLGVIRFKPVKADVPFQAGGYRVIPVETTHRVSQLENAYNYMFETPQGKRLLYACDTGLYPENALKALSGCKVDILVMEVTFGLRTDNDLQSHLNGQGFLHMLNLMIDREIIYSNTQIYATHINHKHDGTPPILQAWFDNNSPLPVKVANDGMILNFT